MSKFRQQVAVTFRRLITLFTPLFLLVLLLHIPQIGVFEKILLTVVLGALEGYLLYKIALPWISEQITVLLMGPGGAVGEEAMIAAARRLYHERRENDALALYEEYSRKHRKRLKGWILRVDFLCDLRRYQDAVEALKEGLHSARWGRQDKAFFLYRIGKIYADHLNLPQKAADYWHEAASKHPRTAYGMEAAKRLSIKT